MQCPDCKRDFPSGLLNDMFISVPGETPHYEKKCPLCGLETMNRLSGLPAGTPFRGMQAQAMYQAALDHLNRTGQNSVRTEKP